MLEAQSSSIGEFVSPLEAEAIAASAYIFGFPLVLLERVHTAVAKPTANAAFPKVTFERPRLSDDGPTPAMFCLDLGRATFVLRISDHPLQIRDAWSNVIASFGSHAIGAIPRAVALTGPRWRGQLPDGLERIAVPTELACIVAPAAAIPFQPPVADVSPGSLSVAVKLVSRMGAGTFLSRLARLMRSNPPAAGDDPVLARLRRIGIAPGEPTGLACLPGELKSALVSGVAAARAAMAGARFARPASAGSAGSCDPDYLGRAVWASTSLLAVLSGRAPVS